MTERAPQDFHDEEPLDHVSDLLAESEAPVLTPVPGEVPTPPVGNGAAKLYKYCAENAGYTNVGPNVQARMRPRLALDFIRESLEQTAEHEGDDSIRPVFDPDVVKRHIQALQTIFGAVPTADQRKNDVRSSALRYYAGKASGSRDLHEINAAFQLHGQFVSAGDTQFQDSLELLTAAFGRSIDEINERARQAAPTGPST